ncbi:DUF5937 family protein [Frigoribacterium sp. 2-23]|uniref:ArsR/SmtB family transcription factor n=1 Tax=Frigoribacterium sp. 2-23 TaxID=3415006 RepID=UPI003C6FAD72
MVLRYVLDGTDLSYVRFGISPLTEMTLSLRSFDDPGRFPFHLPWLRHVDSVRGLLDDDALRACVDGRLWTLDFLTPSPASPLVDIADELAAVARLDPTVVARDIAALHGGTPPPALAGDPRAARDRVVEALSTYWRLCFEPFWPLMRARLEADIVFRAREISNAGLAGMFAGLSEKVRLRGSVVSIRLAAASPERRVETRGSGLTLVPSFFTRGGSVPIEDDAPPTIMYPCRGVGALWQRAAPVAPRALSTVFGEARTRLLLALDEPSSTTALALSIGVTASAVGQHLRALRAAGLLTSHRVGRSVLYSRTDVAEALVAQTALTPAG